MADITQNIGLKKPLENEFADIGIINENMDKIDQTLGAITAVPTTAKDVAGAIHELKEVIDITGVALAAHKADYARLKAAHNGILAQSIINGNFAINQRVKTGTVVLTAGQYGHDRWKAGSGGCTYTFATTNNVTTVTITAGSLVQIIEGLNLFSGTYTLSWSGTAQGKIGAGAYGNSGIKGTVVGGVNLAIEFNVGTLSQVQLRAGEAILPFQPRSFADELLLCQRYYEKSYSYSTALATATLIGRDLTSIGDNTGSSYIIKTISFKVTKRIPPTVSYWDVAGNANKITTVDSVLAGTNNVVPSVVPSSMSDNQFNVGNASVGVAGFMLHWAADAEL